MDGDVWFPKSSIKIMGGELYDKQTILGLDFYFYSFASCHELRIFFCKEYKNLNEDYYLQIVAIPEWIIRKPDLFDIIIKQYLGKFMRRPEIEEKIKNYLLTNK